MKPLVSRYQNVSILDFIGTKMDGGDGDNWSYKTSKAPFKSSPLTNQHPAFYRLDALPVAQSTVSEQSRTKVSHSTDGSPKLTSGLSALSLNIKGPGDLVAGLPSPLTLVLHDQELMIRRETYPAVYGGSYSTADDVVTVAFSRCR